MHCSALPHGLALLFLASACRIGSDKSDGTGALAGDTGTPAITDADSDGGTGAGKAYLILSGL